MGAGNLRTRGDPATSDSLQASCLLEPAIPGIVVINAFKTTLPELRKSRLACPRMLAGKGGEQFSRPSAAAYPLHRFEDCLRAPGVSPSIGHGILAKREPAFTLIVSSSATGFAPSGVQRKGW
jgi:hypothetical protein